MSGAEISLLYRRVLRRGWPGALLQAILAAIFLDHLMAALPDPLAPDAIEQYTAFLGSAGLWWAVSAFILISLLPGCALVLCAYRIALGQSVPAAGALPAGLRVYPAALLISILFMIVVEAASLLFLVPGIYLAGALQLWVVALLAGDARALGSLQLSWRLVLGHWWRSNTMVAMVTLAGVGVGAAAGLITGVALHTLNAVVPPAPAMQRIFGLLPWALTIFLAAPAYPVALVVSYRDLAAPAA